MRRERRTSRSTFGAPKDERRTPLSTFGAPKDERRTPRSTFGAPQDELERPVLRLWYPKMTRFTFRVPQDKRRTPRFTFGTPQERRESRLHRFRPASPQQTLGSQGAPPTERRTGRSHCLLAVAVVAFAEEPRARPSPRSITYVMRGNLCLSLWPVVVLIIS